MCAQEALVRLELAKVLFIPVGEAPHRQIEQDPGADARRRMCELAIEGDERFTVFDLSRELRSRGWQVPAYTLPANLEDVAVLRIVVRNGFSPDLGSILLQDIREGTEALREHGGQPNRRTEMFRH